MNLKDLQNKMNEFDQSNTFLSFIKDNFINQSVEIYCGNTLETIKVDQQSIEKPYVFCGKIIGVLNSFLALNCFSVIGENVVDGNIVFINIDSIVLLKPLNADRPVKNLFVKSGTHIQSVMKNE